MQGYWMAMKRKDLVEKAIVDKRNQEIEKEKKLESAARYHRDLNLLSTQYKNIEENTSGKVQKVNEESRLIEAYKAERKEKLRERRQKLAKLLAKESEIYLVELNTLEASQQKDPWNISTLKDQIETLRKRREEEEAELRKKDMYNLYQQTNIPYVKEHMEKLSDEEMRTTMENKKKELEEQVNQKRMLVQQQLEDLKQLHQNALQDLENVKEEKVLIQERYNESLKAILEDIDRNSIEDAKIKHKLKILEEFSNLIEGVHVKRTQVSNIQSQKRERIAQLRPSKEKVRMMSSECRHEWDLDLATLNYLKKLDMVEELAYDKIQTSINLVADRLAIENQRAEEIQTMFEEEAKKSWNSKKCDWDKELENQNQIMKDVFKYILNRVQEKIKDCSCIQNDISETKRLLGIESAKLQKQFEDEEKEIKDKEAYYQNKLDECADRIQRFNTARKKVPTLHL